MLLHDSLADKEVIIAVPQEGGINADKGVNLMADKGGGHISPDVRKRFAPLECLVPEQRYKQNVDLDLHQKRRPSECSITPSAHLIQDSHRKN